MLELEEVRELLEGRRDAPVEKDDIEIAIQALLAHQIIYPDTSLLRRDVYDLIRQHSIFFARYFNAMGVGLTIEASTGMIALVRGRNRYGWQLARLKKDETLTMLALRLCLDEGLRAGLMDDMGRVETNTDEIFDRIRTLGKVEPPPEQRLEEILKWLRKRGGVLLHEPDRFERVTPLTILPGMRILVDDEFALTVNKWITLGAPEEFFGWHSAQRLNSTREAENADADAPSAATVEGP
jgi:hypothetical protein